MDVWADIRTDVPTQKLSPHRWERRKIKFFADVFGPKVRTSMTQGGLRKLSAGKLRVDYSGNILDGGNSALVIGF